MARRPNATPEERDTMARHGVSRALLSLRMKSRWSRERALSTPPGMAHHGPKQRRFVVGHDERGDDGAWRSGDAPRLSVAVSAYAKAHDMRTQTLFARIRGGTPACIALTTWCRSGPRQRRFVVGHDERGDDGVWRSGDAPRLSVAVSRFAQAQGLDARTLFGRMRGGTPACIALTTWCCSGPRQRRFVVGHDERGDDGVWRSGDAPRLSVAVSRFARAQGLAVQTLFARIHAGVPAAVALTSGKRSAAE